MSMTSELAGQSSVAAAYGTQTTENKQVEKKSNVRGKTIGQPKLSEKAQKYYDQLKRKYSGMDFILVSSDMKDAVQANASKYASMSSSQTVVLIDEEKIERMAEDEEYRKKYEGIIQKASGQLAQMSKQLAKSGVGVKSVGMQVNDNGTATLFASLENNSKAQKARLEKSAAKKAEQKKEDKKAAEKRKEKDAAKDKRTEHFEDSDDTVTITANTIEELTRKVNDYLFMAMSDSVQTDAEKMVGQSFDFWS